MSKPKVYEFDQDQRIFHCGWLGTLVSRDVAADEPSWFVDWEDGTETEHSFKEKDMQRVFG